MSFVAVVANMNLGMLCPETAVVLWRVILGHRSITWLRNVRMNAIKLLSKASF